MSLVIDGEHEVILICLQYGVAQNVIRGCEVVNNSVKKSTIERLINELLKETQLEIIND